MTPVLDFAAREPWLAGLAAVLTVLLVVRAVTLSARSAARHARKVGLADSLTVVSAVLATAVALTGMWRYFGYVLHVAPSDRILFFSMFEVVMVTCAVRARARVLAMGGAGLWGLAVWGCAAGSAVCAALGAGSVSAAVFRFSAPFIAAGLWEGLLVGERQAAGFDSKLAAFAEKWQRRLGLAAPDGLTAGAVETDWRLRRVADAVAACRDAEGRHRERRALRRYRSRMAAACAHTDLSVSPATRKLLLDHLAVRLHDSALLAVTPPSPWPPARQSAPAQDVRARGAQGTAQATADASAQETAEDTAHGGAQGTAQGTAQGKRQPTAGEAAQKTAMVRRLLAAGKLTQKQIADRAGVAESTVRRIKKDMPQLSVASSNGTAH